MQLTPNDGLSKSQFTDLAATNALSKLTIQSQIPIVLDKSREDSLGSCDAVKSIFKHRSRNRNITHHGQKDNTNADKNASSIGIITMSGCKRTHSRSSSQEFLYNDVEMTSPKQKSRLKSRNRYIYSSRAYTKSSCGASVDESVPTSHYCGSVSNIASLTSSQCDVEKMSTADDNATLHSFKPRASSASDDNLICTQVRRALKRSTKSGHQLRENMIVSPAPSRQYRKTRMKKIHFNRQSNNDSSDGRPHRSKLPRTTASSTPFFAPGSRKRATVYSTNNPMRSRQTNKRRTIPICFMELDHSAIRSYSSSSDSSFPSDSDQDDDLVSADGRDGDDEESDYPGAEPSRPPFMVRRALIHLRRPILSSLVFSAKNLTTPSSHLFSESAHKSSL
ncbi:hypothetical protein Ciccas_000545 [Cichlidogyrus casuarinus]|uniref:Uncharacterized protein n=1 Tax=Cichlidogyrus casuarinus TaxID=1844966 RepID=A0ABD2QMK2_9PLAT